MLPATPLPVPPQVIPSISLLFLFQSMSSRRGEHSWERWGSGSHFALANAFSHPVLPYSPLVSIGPIAPHSTATSSTLVSKISVSAPHGT